MTMTKPQLVRHTSAGAKFKLLMWKNFLLQWRHPIQTCTEILLPVLTMTLVLLIRWQVEPHERMTRMYPPLPASTLNYSTVVLAGMNTTRLSIAYSPTSPVLEDVVRSAMVNLFVDNVRQILPSVVENLPNWPDITLPPPFDNITLPPGVTLPPDIIDNIDLDNIDPSMIYDLVKALVRVEAYNSSNDLRGIYVTEETTKIIIAAVEFDDELLGSEELSHNLSYSLRFPERLRLHSLFQTGGREWRTDHVFPVYEVPGPRFAFSWEGGNDPGYVNEMFIALQQAISTELIAKLTGDDEFRSFKVNIQRLPHPAYLQDMGIEVLQLMFPMFLMLSFSYTAINIVRAVTAEKETQLKGTMKLIGLSTWLHWTAWFFKQFIFLIFAAILIIIILKVNWFSNESGFSEYAVFTNTSWTVLFFYLLLYLSCTIFFCFMMSGIFAKASTAALFTGVIWFLSYIPAILMAMDVDMSTTVQVLTCLSINSAMAYGFQLILARESVGGLQWGDFMTSPATESNRFVFGHVVIMMVVNCIVYMLIALYLEQVLPGPIGTPKPWYFPFQYSFWCPSKQVLDPNVLVSNGIENDIIKEKDPIDHAVGVEIQNLTKTFGANIAVNNLSLNIYDDQITVLLGHNGAGKSTTISMLTGNLEVTYGNINVAGYDMSTQTSIARSHIGLCSQHNVLFNELTVREHLQFFASLKGFKGAELHDEIDTLIEKLELQEKRDSMAKGLSGGQKRRLCVGIALSGAARVVLLDEPTSGMDPASRRGLWELLQREKKGRSMIMTTHFMDEADILGDRVAIMAHGQLQCIGSPYFLKRHYGVGYTLVVVKDNDFNYDECTALIEKYIPGIQIKEDRGTEVTYSLTNDYSFIYEQMLNDLETNIDTIKFKNYGLVATTLEDVFMTVGADLAPINSESDDDDTVTTDSIEDAHKVEIESSLEELDKQENSVSGFLLIVQRIAAIWMKLCLVLSRSWLMILLQFVTPILLINATLGVLQFMMTFLPTIQMRHLTLAQGFTGTETLLNYNGTSLSALGALASAAYRSMFENSGLDTMDITDIGDQPMEYYYLNRTNDPLDMRTLRHRILIGSTFDENSATAWFSNFGYHDVAISLAAVHSALLKAKNDTAILNVCNHPLEATYTNQNDLQTMLALMSMQLASGIGSSVGIVSSVFIMFYIKERMSGAKLLQKAAGISPLVLWGSASMFDWAWFLITCISILVSCIIFDVNGLSTAPELGRLYLTFMVYGAAMLPLTYLMSHVFKGPALGFVSLFFLNTILGNLGTQIVDALSTVATTTQEAAVVLDYILQFFPLYSLVTSVRSLNNIGLRQYTCLRSCELLLAIYPNLECTMDTMCQQSPNCCLPEHPYFNWEQPGIARYLTCMVVSGMLFWTILMVIEYRLVNKVWTYKKSPPPLDESTLDEDVAMEAAHAHRALASRHQHGLLANNLAKYYGDHLAVDQVSFSVNDGECFGLLGVNGAGKTTTFKMLMGDEAISSGEAFVSGHSVQKNLNRVHKNIGYCPQFDALFDELTGRETIYMFAMLRGLRQNVISNTAIALANGLGFTKHLDKRVNQYSGGTKRKLNTAVAFLGRTRLVFVDEPTTGVDPAAKRHVWRATRGVQRAGRGVVLTSHSMEECEALCSRLTIMVNGRFQCLGTPQHLKNKFSQGFTLTIKLRREENDTTSTHSGFSVVDSLKNYINSNFIDPKIMEEYQGLLTYYLPDRSMPWSRMFGIMERAKRDLDIEDYSISQTTLEQIFLQFTKYQRQENDT